MSGLRLYVHDAHGRMISGDTRVRKARRYRGCEGNRHFGLHIAPGDLYVISTLYPGDDDFNFLDRDTLQPSRSAARLHVCLRCAGDAVREALEVHLVGSEATHVPDVEGNER